TIAIDHISADTCNPIVYVSTYNGFKLSMDGGETWLDRDPKYGEVYSIFAQSNKLYVGTKEGVAVAAIDGTGWKTFNLSAGSELATSLAVYAEENRAYASVSNFPFGTIWVSYDKGDTWNNSWYLPEKQDRVPDSIFVSEKRLFVSDYDFV